MNFENNDGSESNSAEQVKGSGPKWRLLDWFEDFDEELSERLKEYYKLLVKFNGRINLISSRSEANGDLIHIADCLVASTIILNNTEHKHIYDIGSGNGLPGIVMALMDSSRSFVMIDKDARKTEFIKHVAAELGLKNVQCLQTRIEELKEGTIHCAVSRGFASISKAIISLRKACSTNAEYYHMKSDSWVREVAQIPTQVCSFWEPSLVSEYHLPTLESKFAIILTKKIK